MAAELTELLVSSVECAVAAARQARFVRRKSPVGPQRRVLAPGPATPLWNELVRQILPHLRRRGSKAQLARLLGVPRQRLQACFKAKYACLDAERTLQLVGWLVFFQRGGQLVPLIYPEGPAGTAGRAGRGPRPPVGL